jgi:hypothetical protein
MRSLITAAAILGAAAFIPAGYTAIPDKSTADMAQAVYTASGSNWEVTTGPAHILFNAKDMGTTGSATSATIQQLAKPTHPEAYGVFIGGKNLGDTAQRTYTYFLVRGNGMYMVSVMNGTKATAVVPWTASPNVPMEDASGKASYTLYVHVAPTEIHFQVNGKLVATVPKGMNPVDGISGLRINHNLHLMVTPVAVSK